MLIIDFKESSIIIRRPIPKLTIAAISWFSVKDDINSPIEISEAPNNNKPKKLVKTKGHTGSAKMEIIAAYIMVISNPIANTDKAAKYLPRTIEVNLTGEVNNSWSVFCFFSSLQSRIVKMGTKNITITNKLLNTYVRLLLP